MENFYFSFIISESHQAKVSTSLAMTTMGNEGLLCLVLSTQTDGIQKLQGSGGERSLRMKFLGDRGHEVFNEQNLK